MLCSLVSGAIANFKFEVVHKLFNPLCDSGLKCIERSEFIALEPTGQFARLRKSEPVSLPNRAHETKNWIQSPWESLAELPTLSMGPNM